MQLPRVGLWKEIRSIEAKAGELKGLVERMGAGGLGNDEVSAAVRIADLGDPLSNRLFAMRPPGYLQAKRGAAATHLSQAIDQAWKIPTIQGSHAREASLARFADLQDDLAGMRRSIVLRTSGAVGLGVLGVAGATVAYDRLAH